MRISRTLRFLTVLILIICQPIFGQAQAVRAIVESQACATVLRAPLQAREVLSVHYDENLKKYITVYLNTQIFYSKEFVTKTFRTEYYVTDSPIHSTPIVGEEKYLNEVLPLVKLANQKFEERRGWGKQSVDQVSGENPFSLKNIAVAKKYLAYSSYVLVENHKGDLLGGVRNIEMLDQNGDVIPEEKFLSLAVPKMGLAKSVPGLTVWKNEIGTLCIDETQSPETRRKILLEIWTHLFKFLFSKSTVREKFYDQSFHTYGDETSLRYYYPMGFRKLRIYEHNGQWVNYTGLADKDIPPIMVDGEPWWPLVLLPKDAVKLNERLSNSTLSNVSPEWLANRRSEMADGEDSAFQLGALFPHLLEDLNSENESTFLAALTGITEVIESVSEHEKVAHNVIDDHELGELAIDEIVKIKNQISDFIYELSPKIASMSRKRRHSTVMFLGHILRLGKKASKFFTDMPTFYRDGVFTLLNDPNIDVVDLMMRYLGKVRTPEQWIEDLRIVWPDEDIESKAKSMIPDLQRRLLNDGLSQKIIKNTVTGLRRALFDSPVRVYSEPTVFYEQYYNSSAGTLAMINLPHKTPVMIARLVALAAAEQYLADQKTQHH